MEERAHVYPQHGKPSTKQGGGSPPTVWEVVLLVGDKKNQGEWRTERMLWLSQSKGGVIGG